MIDLINSGAEMWFRYLVSATLQAVFLALVVLTVVWLFRHRSPAWRHALLMLALLKFAVPPTLSLPSGLFSQLSTHPSSPALKSLPYVAPLAPIVDEALWPAEESRPLLRLTELLAPQLPWAGGRGCRFNQCCRRNQSRP